MGRIGIRDKEKFQKILCKGTGAEQFSSVLYKQYLDQNEAIRKIKQLTASDSFRLSETTFKNDFLKFEAVQEVTLIAIICFVLSKKNEGDKLEYSVEDLQRIFLLLNKKDYELGGFDLTIFNRIINFFLGEIHPFGDIKLNDDWVIEGGNSIDLNEDVIIEDTTGDPPIIDDDDKPSVKPLLSDPVWKSLRYIFGSFAVLVIIMGVLANEDSRNFLGSLIGLPSSASSDTSLAYCVFDDTDTTTLKIIVLPFNEQCEYDGKPQDIGHVIQERFELLNTKDDLGISVFYCDKFVYENQAGVDDSIYYFDLLKKFNANLVIFGYNRSSTCSEDGNRICTNMIGDVDKEFFQGSFITKNKSVTAGLNDIERGSAQESIDYIIYTYAIASASYNQNAPKVINYCNYVIDSLLLVGSDTLNLATTLSFYALKWETQWYLNYLDDISADLESIDSIYPEYKLDSSPDFHFYSGQNFLNLGNLDAAYASYKKLLTAMPSDSFLYSVPYTKMAFIWTQKMENDSAKKYYNIAIGYNPSDLEARMNYYNVLQFNDFDEKINTLLHSKRILIKQKGYIESSIFSNTLKFILKELGVTYVKWNEYDKAIPFLTKTLIDEPKNKDLLAKLGLAFYEIDDIDSALFFFKQLDDSSLGGSYLLEKRGICFLRNGLLKEAIEDFSKGIDLYPNFPTFYLNRAKAYHDLGMEYYDLAISDCSRGIEILSEAYPLLYYVGESNLFRNFEIRDTILEIVISPQLRKHFTYNYILIHRIKSINAEAAFHAMRAKLYAKLGDVTLAQEDLNWVLENDFNTDYILQVCALIELAENNRFSALKLINLAIEINPSYKDYYLIRSSIYEQIEMPWEAKKDSILASTLSDFTFVQTQRSMTTDTIPMLPLFRFGEY